jgi:hypothetical protein
MQLNCEKWDESDRVRTAIAILNVTHNHLELIKEHSGLQPKVLSHYILAIELFYCGLRAEDKEANSQNSEYVLQLFELIEELIPLFKSTPDTLDSCLIAIQSQGDLEQIQMKLKLFWVESSVAYHLKGRPKKSFDAFCSILAEW